jgi:hypothetical protein
MLTPYQKRQKDEDFTFDNVKRRRKTKDEQRRSKEQKKKVNIFKTNVLVPNKQNVRRWRHRSGVSPTFSTAGCFVVSSGRFRQRSSMETFKPSAGKLH